MASVLVVGPSGSGKSYFAALMAKKYKSVFVVNGPDDFPRAIHISLEDVPGRVTPNSILIFDDIINPEPRIIAVIKNVLLFSKRHKNIQVLVLTHAIMSNNTYALLQHFDHFVLAKSNRNTKNYSDLLRFFQITQSKGRPQWSDFLKHSEDFLYLKITVNTGEFEIISEPSDDLLSHPKTESSKSEKRKNAEATAIRKKVVNIISSFGDTSKMLALYDHIFQNSPISALNEFDLSLTIYDKRDGDYKKSKDNYKVNICDLLFFVTTPDVVPPAKTVTLFKLFRAQFSIPEMFIQNARFKN